MANGDILQINLKFFFFYFFSVNNAYCSLSQCSKFFDITLKKEKSSDISIRLMQMRLLDKNR